MVRDTASTLSIIFGQLSICDQNVKKIVLDLLFEISAASHGGNFKIFELVVGKMSDMANNSRYMILIDCLSKEYPT